MYIVDESDFKALEDVILKRRYFRNRGKDVETECSRFERAFADHLGCSYSVLVNSGTNALVCALAAIGLKPGDEVIIPSYTYFATAQAVHNLGGVPVIANIDESLTLDPTELKRCYSHKTKAVIAVHMDGLPANLEAIGSFVKTHQLSLIEDVAQAAGGSYRGKRLGSFGELGCFSFNAEKIISCGEGGAVITNHRPFYERSLLMQDGGCLFGATFKDAFASIEPFVGQSMRVSEISGALMNVQLSRLDFILSELRWRKKILLNSLACLDLKIVKSHDEEGECGTCLEIIMSSPEELKLALKKLNRERLIAYPLAARPAHSCWQWMHLFLGLGRDDLYQKSLFLPSIDIITRTLRIDVPFEMNKVELESMANFIADCLKK